MTLEISGIKQQKYNLDNSNNLLINKNQVKYIFNI